MRVVETVMRLFTADSRSPSSEFRLWAFPISLFLPFRVAWTPFDDHRIAGSRTHLCCLSTDASILDLAQDESICHLVYSTLPVPVLSPVLLAIRRPRLCPRVGGGSTCEAYICKRKTTSNHPQSLDFALRALNSHPVSEQ